MRSIDGQQPTDYEETLRSIGALFDERGWRDVAIVEVEHDVIIQVTMPASADNEPRRLETYLLTADDIDLLTRAGVATRRAAQGKRPDQEHDAGSRPTDGTERPAPAPEPGDWRARKGDLPLGHLFALRGDVARERKEAKAPPDQPARVLPFDPERLRAARASTPAPAGPDANAARAAVVMAGIVAARLRSGARLGADDPDLSSLLEQVRALEVRPIEP